MLWQYEKDKEKFQKQKQYKAIKGDDGEYFLEEKSYYEIFTQEAKENIKQLSRGLESLVAMGIMLSGV